MNTNLTNLTILFLNDFKLDLLNIISKRVKRTYYRPQSLTRVANTNNLCNFILYIYCQSSSLYINNGNAYKNNVVSNI